MRTVTAHCKAIRSDGFVLLENLCGGDLTRSILNVTTSQLKETLMSLGDKEIGIGSAAGYREICQRSQDRWDVPINLDEFQLHYKESPWWPLIAEVLGEDAVPYCQGIVSSAPGAPAQEWHIDSPHTAKEHTDANAINVLIALEDISLEMGPTELALGSHYHTNHFQNKALVIDELVYQCSETTPLTLLSSQRRKRFETRIAPMSSGTCLFFDDRILHRGSANHSDQFRHVAYFSYKKNGYSENTYFESERSLSELE